MSILKEDINVSFLTLIKNIKLYVHALKLKVDTTGTKNDSFVSNKLKNNSSKASKRKKYKYSVQDATLMDRSLPGSFVQGIVQARILKSVAISVSRRSFQPRNRTQISHIAGRFFII